MVEKVAFFLIKPGLDKFSTIAGGFQMELNMVFSGNIGKNVLFLACRSVRNSFLKFLVHVLGPQTWPPRAKKTEFGFQT